jgi:hypothetical protein
MDEASDFRGLVVGGFNYQSKRERVSALLEAKPPIDYEEGANCQSLAENHHLTMREYAIPRSVLALCPYNSRLSIPL